VTTLISSNGGEEYDHESGDTVDTLLKCTEIDSERRPVFVFVRI
jgi:hypothetical protein